MKRISTENSVLVDEQYGTSISSSVSSASSTISVYSIADISTDTILLLGEFGQEGTEIVKTSASVAPTGTTVTLSTSTVKSHAKDTKIYVLPYDQAQFYHADTSTGSKALLTTKDVTEESLNTVYDDSTYSSGYYFTRFYNSISFSTSSYSDPIPYDNFALNTVSRIIQSALNETNKEYSSIMTHEMLVEEINSCLRYVRGKLKTWSNNQEFGYKLDQMDRGEYMFALPSTYYDRNSNRSMLQVRIGSGEALEYRDRIEFEDYFKDVNRATVSTECTAGATSLVLSSTDDFDETGTLTTYVANTAYTITYSANDQSTNTLTITALAVTLPVGTNVWDGESEDTPRYYCVADGYLYIWPLCGSSNYGKNISLDFYTDIVEVDSDADEITLAKFDMVKHWLKWQIRNITERSGQPDMQDGDWLLFSAILADAVRRESSGQKRKISPKINGISYRSESGTSFDRI